MSTFFKVLQRDYPLRTIPFDFIGSVYDGLPSIGSVEITALGPEHPDDKREGVRTSTVTGSDLRRASTNGRQGKWLSLLAAYVAAANKEPITIVELGTCVGLSSLYMLASIAQYQGGKLVTFEGSQKLADMASENMQKLIGTYKYNNVAFEVVVGDIDQTLPDFVDRADHAFHLAFIDGNHREQATLNYHQILRKNMHGHGVIVHDDISWGAGMTKAWSEIKAMESGSEIGELYLGGRPSRGVIRLGTKSDGITDRFDIDGVVERNGRKIKNFLMSYRR